MGDRLLSKQPIRLLLVNLGFFMGHIYWSEICQLSVFYIERHGSLISTDYWSETDPIIARKMARDCPKSARTQEGSEVFPSGVGFFFSRIGWHCFTKIGWFVFEKFGRQGRRNNM